MDEIVLRVPAAPAYAVVVRLVLGGIGTRLDLPYDVIDDLQLAVDAILDQRRSAAETVTVRATSGADRLAVLIGPFEDRLDVAGRRAIAPLVRGLRVTTGSEGEWLELEAGPGEAGQR